MSLWKSIFGEKKIKQEKQEQDQEQKMAAMLEEIAAQSVVAENWEAKDDIAKGEISSKDVAEEILQHNLEGGIVQKQENNIDDALNVKPLPLMFEKDGLTQEIVVAVSAAVAYIMEEERLAFQVLPSVAAPPIARKAGKWSFIGRQELMLARQV